MSYLSLVIQLVSGAVGANVLGAAVKSLNLGRVGNTIAGLIGGGIGGQLLASLAGGGSADGLSATALLGSIIGGAVGGGALTALSAYLKMMFAKPT
jgi:uncharacterized membrane protein YeaQ/YmgE (transglycosylase-associated protein family)